MTTSSAKYPKIFLPIHEPAERPFHCRHCSQTSFVDVIRFRSNLNFSTTAIMNSADQFSGTSSVMPNWPVDDLVLEVHQIPFPVVGTIGLFGLVLRLDVP